MEQIFANAKINLTLDIISRRENGYHEIKSFMQKISLSDRITLKKIPEKIVIRSDCPLVPLDRTNICYKAAEKFFAKTGIKSGVEIFIEKHIPIGAGLAGGSADGAATLRGLNLLFKENAPLEEIAPTLGADVSFCLSGKSTVCEGIGEIMTETDFPQKKKFSLVVAKGEESLSTPEIYRAFDEKGAYKNGDETTPFVEALKRGDDSFLRHVSNDFEKLVMERIPDVARLKKIMTENGAVVSQMSGSGPSVFGIFSDPENAKEAERKIREEGFFAETCSFI